MCVCRDGLPGVCVYMSVRMATCVCICVHEGVRLIEVVRVKMIPSGGQSRWRRWVGSAVGDGERERDQESGMRWRGKRRRSGGQRDCSSPPTLRGSDT